MSDMASSAVRTDGGDATRDMGDRLARYLTDEHAYHADLLQLLRQFGAGRLTADHQAQIDQLRNHREHLSRGRSDLLGSAPADGPSTLSELVQLCDSRSQRVLQTQIQSVRSLIIQTRIAAERLGRRFALMHDCLEEILTGKPPARSTSYDRAGRLTSSSSSRSLLTRRA
jgi:hypothetical protein